MGLHCYFCGSAGYGARLVDVGVVVRHEAGRHGLTGLLATAPGRFPILARGLRTRLQLRLGSRLLDAGGCSCDVRASARRNP